MAGKKFWAEEIANGKGHELLVREQQERLVGKSGQGRAGVSLAWLKSSGLSQVLEKPLEEF